jgi:hypothetical protein
MNIEAKKGWLLVGALLLMLVYPMGRAFGQAVYGSIIGTVTDSSGAAVPDAKVTITDVNRNVTYTSTTNTAGNYEQQHLIVGVYNVRVEKTGFQAYVQENVQVNVDVVTNVNASLTIGAVTQEVTVTAAVPLLKTERTDVSTVFSDRQVEELPIYNRNFVQFELLTPGTQRLGWQHAASENPQGSIQIMVNGQHFAGTSFQLDGTDNQDPILGIIVINPNIDGVTEAKITTQDYDAEFGQATAGVVTAQTKSGTNDLHGSAFYFRRDNNLTGRDPFAQSKPIVGTNNRFIPDALWNQFGGSLGAPIRKNKTFIFGDFQGTRRSLGGSNQARVPNAAERAGDLSDLGRAIFNPYDASGNVIPCTATNCPRQEFVASASSADPNYNPACTSAAGCKDMIPAKYLSPQAQALMQFIPMPTTPSITNPGTPNFSGSGNQVFNSDGYDVRADQYQTEKLHLFGRYSFQRFKRAGPGMFGLEAGGPAFVVDPSLGQFAGQSSVRNQSIAFGFDYTLKPTWLTDFRFGFFRYRVAVSPNGLGTTPAKDAGVPGLNLDTTTSGMPALYIGDLNNMNVGYSLGTNQCNCPLNEQEQQFQFVNNWTNIRGNHTLKFGADIRYAMNLRVPSDSHRAGELSFAGPFTEGPSGGGIGLATFLLGEATSFTRYVSKITDAAERQKRWFFYGQDTWRFTPKLTLNYGLRWEVYFPQTVNGPGNGGWVQAATGETWIGGQKGIGLNGNVQNSFTNFAPRLGIAYQINPKTVLRMGYGRSFQIGTFGSIFGHTVTQNLPVLANQNLSAPASWDGVFSLAQGPPGLDPATILQNNCNAITLVTAASVVNTPYGKQCLGVNGFPLIPDGISPHIHPIKQRMPTVDAWNVSLQRAFSNDLSVEAAYVANKGTHGFNGDGPNYDINTAPIAGFTAGIPTSQRKPFYPLFGWTQGLNYYGDDASNTYESMQLKVDKRFSNGYSVMAHYTFAHAMQYDGNGYYIWDPSLVRGPSDFQRNHVLIVSQIYNLPFGKGRKYLSSAGRALDYVVGGWQVNSIWTFMSGVPWTPSYRDCGADQDTGVCRPDLVGSASASNQGQHGWFLGTGGQELAANGQTIGPWRRPQKGTFGNVGDNSFRGPRFWQTDASIFKNFRITEKVTGQLRGEIFNFFNHVNLGQPNGTVDDPAAGTITGLAAGALMRQVQFGVRLEF